MAFEWSDLLKVARYLVSQCNGNTGLNDEALQRCAVSRAYYAAFCHARNYARDAQGYQPTYKSDDHWRVRQHLVKNGSRAVASDLDKLRQWRNDCDYFDNAPVAAGFSLAVEKAESVLNQLR